MDISRKTILIYGGALLFILGFVVFLLIFMMPNNKLVSFNQYYSSTKYTDETYDVSLPHIVFEDKLMFFDKENAVLEITSSGQKRVYLSTDFVKTYLDEYLFVETDGNVTITTENKVIRMKTEQLTYTINNKAQTLTFPLTRFGEHFYMPINLCEELYNITSTYNETYKSLVIDFNNRTYNDAYVTGKKAVMRYAPDKKAYIQEKLPSGTRVTVFGTGGKNEEYSLIRSESGLLGFCLSKDISDLEERERKLPEEFVKAQKKTVGKDGMQIFLGWDQVTAANQNAKHEERFSSEELDVLSPTWFALDKDKKDGTLTNIADLDYVSWAHSEGMQVWPLVSDSNGRTCEAVLSDNQNRQRLINQILTYVSIYKLDGINIDFEYVPAAAAPYYVQFFRELSPLINEQGAYLTVDMYVPSAWSMYYNRKEVGKVVDYVCVMTYDEHYSGSPQSGPVASINFVSDGIKQTIQEVPKEKIIMGLPYYVRIWREVMKDGAVEKHTIRDVGMNYGARIFAEAGATVEWDIETGTTYGEYTTIEDARTIRYKAWMEDDLSIGKKMEVYKNNGIAGVAAWRLGLEKESIPQLIRRELSALEK